MQESGVKIKKLKLSIILIVVILLSGYVWCTFNQEKIKIEKDKYYEIIDIGKGRYRFTIYNTDGKVVKKGESYRIEPLINYIDQQTIQIMVIIGTDTFYCLYYDTINDRLSEQYDSPIAAKFNKIAFLKHKDKETVLIVKDMYNENNFYKEYLLDFSPVLSPIISAEFINEDALLITYLSGDLYKEKTELLFIGEEEV